MFLLSLVFAANAFADSASPLRLGLGLDHSLPQFTDENLLSGIRQAVESSGVNPIYTIKVGAADETTLKVSVLGPKGSADFACTRKDGQTECVQKTSLLKTANMTEVPFGNVKAYGFKTQTEADGYGVTGWIAITTVSVYALKKVGNWWFTGSPWADTDPHSHFFLTRDQMQSEYDKHSAILARIKDNVSKDLIEAAGPLIAAASCGHDHDHDHHHHHHDHDGGCSAIHPETVADAQKTLSNGGLVNFGAKLTHDIYIELIRPMYDVVWATVNPEMRKQLLTFADLVTRRMLEERGVLPGVVTIAAVSTAEVVWETLETFLMPTGHFMCNVMNVAILGMAAGAYSTYQCLRETDVLQGRGFMARMRAAMQISRIQWRAGYELRSKTEGLSERERVALSMHVVYRMVERDLRHSRNLDWIEKRGSREFAKTMGELKRDLHALSLRAVVNSEAGPDWSSWMRRLAELRAQFKGEEPSLEQPPAIAEDVSCEKLVEHAS
jgi:hypothetical protein